MEILTGALLGLSTLLFMGAVFFYLIKTAVISGTKAGIAVASGILVGDIIYVGLLLFGFSEILENLTHNAWFAFFGGLILLGIGISYLLKKHPVLETTNTSSVSLWIHFTKGFILNFVNPFVAAVWIGFLAVNESQFENLDSITISLITTLIVIFLTDIAKVIFAKKLSNYLTPKILKVSYKVIGALMFLFGLRLLFEFF